MPSTTTYTAANLKHEAISAIRQYGRQRKVRVKFLGWTLEISESNFPTLIARGWAGSGRSLDDAFSVRVAI